MLVLLLALPALMTTAGPFVAWNAPLLPAIVLVNYLIYRRLIPADQSFGSLDRRTVVRMAAGNYGGNLFALAGNLYLPVLVANLASASEAAYFYVPWLFSLSLQLVAINVMTSLTVEAALDMAAVRRLARQALRHSLRLVMPLVALTLVVAPWILLIFGQDYSDAGTPLLRWLALGALPNIIVTLGISVARIEHKGSIVVGFPAAHAIAVIALSALLVPSLGIEAVGIAWTGSQTVLALAMLATILRPVLFGSGGSGAVASSR
jgi:O-antigen/teichoic acid export membrane protein